MALKKIFLLLGVVAVLFSCEKDSPSSGIVDQAQALAESNPSKALDLLDDISNPENMDREEYMKYVVTLVQTKFKTRQNITNDTLIFEAERYFSEKNKADQAALANLYAGIVYLQNGESDKAVTSFFKAENNACQAENNLTAGRSSNNIGYLYYEQDVMDSAVVYYQKALDYYEKGKVADSLILQTLTYIGRTYEHQKLLDEAKIYFDRGLDLANKINCRKNKSYFSHNLGIVYRKTGDYKLSEQLLHSALSYSPMSTDSLKVYLSLSLLNIKQNKPDSAKYYKEIVEKQLYEVSDNYTLRVIYEAFSDYYQQTGNYKQAAQYLKLEKEVRAEIEAQNRAKEIQQAHHKYYMQQHRERFEASEREQNIYMLILSGIIAVMLALLAFFIYILHKNLPKVDDDYEILWRGYIRSVNERDNLIDYGQWTTRMLLLERESHFHDPYQDSLLPKDLWKIENMLRRTGLYSPEQYIEWAKNYFCGFPEIDKIIGPLTDQQLVLFAMCINGFSDREIRDAFKLSKIELRIKYNELEIAFLKADYLSRIHIQLMMYYKG